MYYTYWYVTSWYTYGTGRSKEVGGFKVIGWREAEGAKSMGRQILLGS